MKNLLLVAAVILMAACQSKIKQESANPKTESIQTNVVVVDQLLAKAETLVDKPVVVQGHVTHTCKHSGKRCFIVGDDANLSIRVEAGGQIQGFNRELVGNSIAVKGILKERRLTAEYIDQWEEKVQNQEAQEDGSAETCAAEMNNINNMRQWMEDNEKNYYSIYYINGENYDIVD
ncbi:hypothetical protein [Sunxiuqinia elliptica]|uniref:Lipoprotein n=1 Tax=Sunxiuqinia elliptica TaxID=655355 RepID=A0A1I2C9Q6_9BACT|nr:hypothetical protein [Sunxiuqinia elliptica]TDO03843.1 hypothetical protein DET52_102178 [Sunxiuqinia elliptica]TDO62125.1 hypothetical protein DET65_1855 [Sunxiuqinia elliptica]SFE65056.1 hypothetical protein SAMN05216283_101662 [Sunxiuqinia elliptica]